MDKLDRLILSELLKDPQLSFVTIANKLGVSPFTVRKRYESMKKEGLIQKCAVSIDLSKIGYHGKVFLMVTNASNYEKSVTIESLTKMKNIIVTGEIIGTCDIFSVAAITDVNSVRDLVRKIKALPSVQRVEIACIDDTAFPINASYGKILSEKNLSLK